MGPIDYGLISCGYCYGYRPNGKTVYSRQMDRTTAFSEAEKLSVAIPGMWVTVYRMSSTRDVVAKFKDGRRGREH